MTDAEKRTALRRYMVVCPACVPEDADYVADEELDGWLESHGWPTTPPPSALDAEEEAEFAELERRAAEKRREGQ